jgi:AsmA protein
MPQRPASRGLPRPVRIGLWSLAVLVVLAVVGAGIFLVSFDPDSLKPRIVAAVKQQTGRDLTLQGPIRVGLSLRPTLTVQGVAFANPPGFSRPQMVTLERLDLQLSLIPLLSHQIEIDRLVLIKPDILLETDAKGQRNWQFTPDTSRATPQTAPAAAQERTPTRISVAAVRIEDGTVTWRDAAAGQGAVVGIKTLDASTASPDANVHISAAATYNGTPFTVAGELGPLTRLQDPAASIPWPVQLNLGTTGAKLTVDAAFTQPLEGRGYTIKLAATIPDLAALSSFLPGRALPALRDVNLAAQLADKGGKLPDVSRLTLHVGPSDLSATVAGLKLDKLEVAAPRLDQPVQVAGQGSFDDAPATLAGTVGVPAALLSGTGSGSGPVPIDLNLKAAGSTLTVKGAAASDAHGRPSLQGDVKADTVDADKLLAAFRKPAPAGAPAASPAPAGPPPSRPPKDSRVIPDTPIPFDLLRPADVDATITVGELKSGGVSYRAIALHLALHDGQLHLDPFAADLPEGHLDGSLTADARQPAPPVALRLHAPGIALQPLLAALGEPGFATGKLEVYADLHGAGATPHAIAGTLDGSLGLAMAKGTIDNRLLGSALGTIVRDASVLDLVGRGGNSEIECFTTRIDTSHGVGTLHTLLLSSSLLTLTGDGSMNFGAETLDLRVRPQARVAGTGLVVPLRVTGSFRAPNAVPDPAAAIAANAGTVAGLALRGATPFGAFAGALGEQKLLGGGGGGADCGAALAIARGQPASTAPAAHQPTTEPAPSHQPAPQQKPPNAGSVLRQLFR